MLRHLNRQLGRMTGFHVQRARRAPRRRHATAAPAAPAARRVAYRPPQDPRLDRLLRRPVFIMSPVRSGSTLLRMLLDGHSRLHAPHELHVRRLEVVAGTALAGEAMAELDLHRGDLEHLLWDRVLHRELVRSGKDVLVEKTPSNTFAYKRIAACWPDARFVFLLRHPASVAQSWYEADPGRRTPEEAALQALHYVRATERARRALPGHVVRYEELTADPEAVLRGVCAFLEVEFEPGMLDYGARPEGELQKGLGDWKEKIRSGRVQAGRALPEAGDVPEPLREISAAWGYVKDLAAPAGPAAGPAGAAGAAGPSGAAGLSGAAGPSGAAGTAASAEPPGDQDAGVAEVAEVWPRDGAIRIVGRLPGAAAQAGPPGWRLTVSLTGAADLRLGYPAMIRGERFDVSVPVADLAPAGISLPAKWDLHLTRGDDAQRVRLQAARHLRDIEPKKNILVFPAQSVSSDEDAIQVKPYYTVRDNLSIACHPRDTPSRTAS